MSGVRLMLFVLTLTATYGALLGVLVRSTAEKRAGLMLPIGVVGVVVAAAVYPGSVTERASILAALSVAGACVWVLFSLRRPVS